MYENRADYLSNKLILNEIAILIIFQCSCKINRNQLEIVVKATQGGSPLSDCKITSLSMSSISCCTRPHVFTSFPRLKLFFQSLANDDIKVNKTHRISAKTDKFRN